MGGLNVASGAGAFTVNGGAFDFNQVGRGIVNLSASTLTINSDLSFTSQPIDAAAGGIVIGGNVSVAGRLFARGAQLTTIARGMSGAGSIVKLDGGTLRLAGDNTFAGGMLVLGGAVELAHPHAADGGAVIVRSGATLRLADGLTDAADLNGLTIDSGGKLEVGRGTVALHYPGTTPYATILAQIDDNRVSSAFLDQSTAIGIVDVVADHTLRFGYARLGDTDLNGSVDFTDLLTMAKNYGRPTGGRWELGDTNHDAAVDFNDLLALARNYGAVSNDSLAGLTGKPFADEFALAMAVAPEPVSGLTLVLCSTALGRRRPRRP